VKKEIKKKFTISKRMKMGSDAKNTPLTKEEPLNMGQFTDEKLCLFWIEKNGNHNFVYIVRDEKGKMKNSYCWKGKKWGTVNNLYFGGYKIGKPVENCGKHCLYCVKEIDCPLHPSVVVKN